MSFSGLTNFQIDEELTTWPGFVAGEATVMIREQRPMNDVNTHWSPRGPECLWCDDHGQGAPGDEDDMTTEAGHGHGDDMTHGNRHDHTCPDTRQYNLLAPETEVISDWQRSKLLPHPAHSPVQATNQGPGKRGLDQSKHISWSKKPSDSGQVIQQLSPRLFTKDTTPGSPGHKPQAGPGADTQEQGSDTGQAR